MNKVVTIHKMLKTGLTNILYIDTFITKVYNNVAVNKTNSYSVLEILQIGSLFSPVPRDTAVLTVFYLGQMYLWQQSCYFELDFQVLASKAASTPRRS